MGGSGRIGFWSATLAALDSDGDGVTNGQELGDPDGDGTLDASIGVTLPGDPSRFVQVQQPPPQPPTGGDGGQEPAGPSVTLQLRGMNPHVGQKFEARLIDPHSGFEVQRVSLDAIAEANRGNWCFGHKVCRVLN